jgi:hypothetical protein
MLDNHPPFDRIIRDQATAGDRQWLRMLNDVFDGVSFEDLVGAGMNARAVTGVLGIVALHHRVNQESAGDAA